MKCIIVESPAKAKKFSEMLSKEEYIVTSSFGHFRDLDKKKMSIDTKTFTPSYIITNQKIASQLKQYCKQVGVKNIILGPESALATTATDGFNYIRGGAGVPTGTPATAVTGHIPMYADTTNNKLYIYSGGSWVALN